MIPDWFQSGIIVYGTGLTRTVPEWASPAVRDRVLVLM